MGFLASEGREEDGSGKWSVVSTSESPGRGMVEWTRNFRNFVRTSLKKGVTKGKKLGLLTCTPTERTKTTRG